jgi:hypothetical protein
MKAEVTHKVDPGVVAVRVRDQTGRFELYFAVTEYGTSEFDRAVYISPEGYENWRWRPSVKVREAARRLAKKAAADYWAAYWR